MTVARGIDAHVQLKHAAVTRGRDDEAGCVELIIACRQDTAVQPSADEFQILAVEPQGLGAIARHGEPGMHPRFVDAKLELQFDMGDAPRGRLVVGEADGLCGLACGGSLGVHHAILSAAPCASVSKWTATCPDDIEPWSNSKLRPLTTFAAPPCALRRTPGSRRCCARRNWTHAPTLHCFSNANTCRQVARSSSAAPAMRCGRST